ncbi:hypothetical protein [Rickettsia endosymbiont of Orchestes rusci]
MAFLAKGGCCCMATRIVIARRGIGVVAWLEKSAVRHSRVGGNPYFLLSC